MELVEGETLAERIVGSGRIEVEEAVEIARQIAGNLNAAHDSGIIHRDLKPANVKVMPDGKVKVHDFGLAKAYEADGSPSKISRGPSRSPTMAFETQMGMIMGSAAYMSPEQARGNPVDQRADIWAFGCVLYAMLTGASPFGGATTSDSIASILKEQPDWRRLPTTTPMSAQALLRRCLRRNQDQRLHAIADARIELEEALSEERGETPAARSMLWASVTRRQAVTYGIFIVAAIAATAAVWQLLPKDRLIYLMDTSAPLGVYDATTRNEGGTNADDLSDLLGNLPVSVAKEAVSPLWHRQYQILLQRLDLIVIHRSAFAHQPSVNDDRDSDQLLGELARLGLENPYELGWSKLIDFLGYIALGSQERRFVVYGRGFPEPEQWIASAEIRYPQFRGRITVYSVPLDADGNASFRDLSTGEHIKQLITSILGLEWRAPGGHTGWLTTIF